MFLACCLALSLGVPLLTPAETGRVLGGEVLARSETSGNASGKASGYGVGAIAIDRSVADTWAVLANYADKAEYQPRVSRCTVLGREGDVLRVAMEVSATIMTVRYTGLYTLDPVAHTVRWKLDKTAAGNGIQDMEGGYALIRVSEARTILYFRSYVDSGRMVPRFIQDHFSVKAIPDLLKSVKARVESGGTYRK